LESKADVAAIEVWTGAWADPTNSSKLGGGERRYVEKKAPRGQVVGRKSPLCVGSWC